MNEFFFSLMFFSSLWTRKFVDLSVFLVLKPPFRTFFLYTIQLVYPTIQFVFFSFFQYRSYQPIFNPYSSYRTRSNHPELTGELIPPSARHVDALCRLAWLVLLTRAENWEWSEKNLAENDWSKQVGAWTVKRPAEDLELSEMVSSPNRIGSHPTKTGRVVNQHRADKEMGPRYCSHFWDLGLESRTMHFGSWSFWHILNYFDPYDMKPSEHRRCTLLRLIPISTLLVSSEGSCCGPTQKAFYAGCWGIRHPI